LPGGGTIIIRRDGDNLVVTGGPDTETQHPSTKVARTDGGLTFEIHVGAESLSVLRFDLKISGREMTGTIVALRDGTETHGRLAFSRP